MADKNKGARALPQRLQQDRATSARTTTGILFSSSDSKFPLRCQCYGSGAFYLLDPGSGSGMNFFPDPYPG
jgi:hypothetical protein